MYSLQSRNMRTVSLEQETVIEEVEEEEEEEVSEE